MKHNIEKHLIYSNTKVIEALAMLDILAADAILFVVANDHRLVGSLTDGDVRRGLLKGLTPDDYVTLFIQPNPRFISQGTYSLEEIIRYRTGNFKVIPILDDQKRVVNIINFRLVKSYLPVDAVIMAGGRGERLRPLTDTCPKSLLKIGDKPIIEHNVDRLIQYGIENYWISINYLGNQIQNYFQDGKQKGIKINYLEEDKPMGTIGSVSQVSKWGNANVLLTNSDLLTNLDYEDFYQSFITSGADLSVVTIPYEVNIPYAVLETSNGHVLSFKEKPTYSYYSNGGIYLMKKEVLNLIPHDSFFNATDLMELLIQKGRKVHSYPLRGYWLDIGRHEDFLKAEEDIKHIRF